MSFFGPRIGPRRGCCSKTGATYWCHAHSSAVAQIHLHSGASEPARRLADANVEAFKIDEYDAVIVNVAGCGAMLKDYGHHWQDEKTAEREQFVAKVKDVHEFLSELGPVRHARRNQSDSHVPRCLPLGSRPKDSRSAAKTALPNSGLNRADLPESELCCGAAGTYNLTQPEMAQRLARRKLQNIQSTGGQCCHHGQCRLHFANRSGGPRSGAEAAGLSSHGSAGCQLSR